MLLANSRPTSVAFESLNDATKRIAEILGVELASDGRYEHLGGELMSCGRHERLGSELSEWRTT